MAVSANFNCGLEVFRALQGVSVLRQVDKDEILDALDATSHSPALTEEERKLLARCRCLLNLSWSGDWVYLQVVVLESIEVLKVEVQLHPRDEEVWQTVLHHGEDAAVVLQRAATSCRYLWHAGNLGRPWASWLDMAAGVMSRESHFTVEPASNPAVNQ
eukprot:Skav233153  [mRNA]  locus=scaffold1669:222173:222649:+ [translate_table: standard]